MKLHVLSCWIHPYSRKQPKLTKHMLLSIWSHTPNLKLIHPLGAEINGQISDGRTNGQGHSNIPTYIFLYFSNANRLHVLQTRTRAHTVVKVIFVTITVHYHLQHWHLQQRQQRHLSQVCKDTEVVVLFLISLLYENY